MRYRACQTCTRSIGAVNVGGNLVLTAIKGFLGVAGGSQALVADAIHSLADLLSSGLLLVGLRVARRPADERHNYGYGKVEFLVAVGIYTLLLGAGGFIMYDSVHMIVDKEEVRPSVATIFGALLSAVINEMMYRQSRCAGRQLRSPSIVANATEKRADVYSSLAVLAGILGAKLGIHILDPLAAVLVAALILHSSFKGIWEAGQGLLDSSLEVDVMCGIEAAALGVPGVRGLGRVRSREIGQRVWVDVEVHTDGDQTLAAGERLRRQVVAAVRRTVERPGDILVHLRPASRPDDEPRRGAPATAPGQLEPDDA
ncbi:MAG TPA: cation diffusion facilitator family transporter [Polyangia bacterium]|jgi:cation diffusion facilitator family transporter